MTVASFPRPKVSTMTKTFWLSFSDHAFLGVSIVDVDDVDAAAALTHMPATAQPGAEWLAAALRKAWALGCNFGGEALIAELPPEIASLLPHNRRLTPDEIDVFGERRGPTRAH